MLRAGLGLVSGVGLRSVVGLRVGLGVRLVSGLGLFFIRWDCDCGDKDCRVNIAYIGASFLVPLSLSLALSLSRHRLLLFSILFILFFLLCSSSYSSYSPYSFRSRWAYLFTNDIVVVDIVVSILPVLVLYVVTDGVQSALTGVLKGCYYSLVLFFIFIIFILFSF